MFGFSQSNDKPFFVKELSHYPIKCLNEADAENMLGSALADAKIYG